MKSKTFKFGDIALQRKETINPKKINQTAYLGLEHINQNSLSINSIGSSNSLESNKFIFSKGDILFGKLRPYFRKVYSPNFDGICSTDIWVVQPKSESICKDFLFYLMADKRFINFANQGTTGTRMPRATWEHVSKYEVNYISYDEQRKISRILKSLDNKIDINQKMKETLEEIAKALFKSWFVDFDPVKAKAEGGPTGLSKEISDLFPDSFEDFELGKIPQGWKFSTLHEVFDIEGGTQPPAKTFIDKEKEGYIRLLQIRDYNVDNHKTYVPLKKNLRIVDEDDVLIGRYGSGNGNFMEDSLGRPLRGLSGAINVAIVRTIPKMENSREYIANLVSSGLFYRWIVGGSSRAVQAGFKKDDLKLIKLPIPSLQVLSVFEEFGFLIWKKTKVLNQENKILAELRDTLIPKLISGEIKISDAESIVEEAGI